MSQSYRDNGVVLQQHLHAPRPALPCREIQLVDERESEREREQRAAAVLAREEKRETRERTERENKAEPVTSETMVSSSSKTCTHSVQPRPAAKCSS
jgi:hypothetical protein